MWSAVWTEIIRVISNCEYDFRPKLHNTRFNYHFFLIKIERKEEINNCAIEPKGPEKGPSIKRKQRVENRAARCGNVETPL